MNLYLFIILFIIIGGYLLDLAVEVMDLRHMSEEVPGEFKDSFDEPQYSRSQEYIAKNARFSNITTSILTPVQIIFIVAGGFDIVDQMARSFGLGAIWTGLIFFAILLIAFTLIHLPFSVYQTFVIEQKYGFNRTTAKTFTLDLLKGWALSAVFGGFALGAVLWLFQWELAWLYCWAAISVYQVLLTYIAPVIFLPLFNKFVPLGEGELKKTIEEYIKSQDFRMKGVFVMDGSRRSTKTNAFFTGLGQSRRIVLYDTLVKSYSPDEIVSVLAHEVGHYKKKHILKMLGASILTGGIMFYLLSLFINNPGLFAAFRMKEMSVYAGIFFFGFLYAPIAMVISIAAHALSRKFEFQADAYASRTCHGPEGLISSLKKLSVGNFINLFPHPLKVFLHYSHPPVLERIQKLRGSGASFQ